MYAYNDILLADAMKSMSEYFIFMCNKQSETKSLDFFLCVKAFMKSELRRKMDLGSSHYLFLTPLQIQERLETEIFSDIPARKYEVSEDICSEIGAIYCFIHWITSDRSSEIVNILPPEDIYEMLNDRFKRQFVDILKLCHRVSQYYLQKRDQHGELSVSYSFEPYLTQRIKVIPVTNSLVKKPAAQPILNGKQSSKLPTAQPILNSKQSSKLNSPLMYAENKDYTHKRRTQQRKDMKQVN